MTQAEKIIAAVVIGMVSLALLLPVDQAELAITVQLLLIGAVALLAGAYIWQVNRRLTKAESEYLWTLVRRDKRVALGFGLLLLLGLLILLPRLLGADAIVQRPWGVVLLVAALDLFAVGLIDDALIVRRDRRLGNG